MNKKEILEKFTTEAKAAGEHMEYIEKVWSDFEIHYRNRTEAFDYLYGYHKSISIAVACFAQDDVLTFKKLSDFIFHIKSRWYLDNSGVEEFEKGEMTRAQLFYHYHLIPLPNGTILYCN